MTDTTGTVTLAMEVDMIWTKTLIRAARKSRASLATSGVPGALELLAAAFGGVE